MDLVWNELDPRTDASDAVGPVSFTYNHQGLWTGATTSTGLWRWIDYDVKGVSS